MASPVLLLSLLCTLATSSPVLEVEGQDNRGLVQVSQDKTGQDQTIQDKTGQERTEPDKR